MNQLHCCSPNISQELDPPTTDTLMALSQAEPLHSTFGLASNTTSPVHGTSRCSHPSPMPESPSMTIDPISAHLINALLMLQPFSSSVPASQPPQSQYSSSLFHPYPNESIKDRNFASKADTHNYPSTSSSSSSYRPEALRPGRKNQEISNLLNPVIPPSGVMRTKKGLTTRRWRKVKTKEYYCDKDQTYFPRFSEYNRHMKSLHRHELKEDTYYFFCPNVVRPWNVQSPSNDKDKCTCPQNGYSRKDALLRHLKNREKTGDNNLCSRLAKELGWDPKNRDSVEVLRNRVLTEEELKSLLQKIRVLETIS